MHDEPLACRHHQTSRMLARDERAAYAHGDHRLPSPQRLLPEWNRPGEPAIFDHPFVTAPRAVHEHVESTTFRFDALEHSSESPIVGGIAGHWHDATTEIGVSRRSPGRVHGEPRSRKTKGHAFPDASARARDERNFRICRIHLGLPAVQIRQGGGHQQLQTR